MQAQAFISMPGYRSADFYFGQQTQIFYSCSGTYDLDDYGDDWPDQIINRIGPLLIAVTGPGSGYAESPTVNVFYQWDVFNRRFGAGGMDWIHTADECMPLGFAAKIEKWISPLSRTGMGYNFVSPLLKDDVSNGVIKPAAMGRWQSLADGLASSYTVRGVTFTPKVRSVVSGHLLPIVHTEVRQRVAVLRRRLVHDLPNFKEMDPGPYEWAAYG